MVDISYINDELNRHYIEIVEPEIKRTKKPHPNPTTRKHKKGVNYG